jgi:hypothetical protein
LLYSLLIEGLRGIASGFKYAKSKFAYDLNLAAGKFY